MPLAVHNSEAFAQAIEASVHDKKMTYMEAVIDYCDQRDLEVETIVPFLTDKIRTAIAHEGQALHLLPKTDELPI